MKSFEIDNKEYRMPESLREISLGDFIKLQHIMQEDIAETLKNCKVISLLTKVELGLLTNAGHARHSPGGPRREDDTQRLAEV